MYCICQSDKNIEIFNDNCIKVWGFIIYNNCSGNINGIIGKTETSQSSLSVYTYVVHIYVCLFLLLSAHTKIYIYRFISKINNVCICFLLLFADIKI